MARPDDIPQDVWSTAEREAFKYVEWLGPTAPDDAEHVLAVSFARAIMAERQKAERALTNARLQIEYMHDKFMPTPSGIAVTAQIDDFLGGHQ